LPALPFEGEAGDGAGTTIPVPGRITTDALAAAVIDLCIDRDFGSRRARTTRGW
jgi:hypothetical protein